MIYTTSKGQSDFKTYALSSHTAEPWKFHIVQNSLAIPIEGGEE